mmetsp:Transcript_87261/g.130921  ORF Transcript_87261/g.130921 Transcript_87261/m.130921 type:complete len:203 (+) Transcript_87261:168-776(+)
MDWILNKFKVVMPDGACSSGLDKSAEDVPWLTRPNQGELNDHFQKMKLSEYLASAPASPVMSAADTMSRRSGNSSPPGSLGGHFSRASSSSRLSLKDIKRQILREKKCESCDSVCDVYATTCEICGEHMADIWTTTAKMRAEAFNREWMERPAEPYVKEKMQPIQWATKELKFRSPNGGSRTIVVPVLAKEIRETQTNGLWM